MSQHYRLVPGSVYDGDTLTVTDGTQPIKIRLCGIDAPEKDQPLGVASRDHLRSLIARGNGSLVVVPVARDRYGRQVAEVFVPIGGAEEVLLNAQMVVDGYAYHYTQYSDACPNGELLPRLEAQAQRLKAGVWSNAEAVKPWEHRN